MAASPRVVTIDGPAGVGKSTLAKRLAQELGLPYLDTGAMFRAVALRLGQGSWEWPAERIAAALKGMGFGLEGSGADTRVCVDGRALGPEIRSEQVAMWASNLAALPVVREFLKAAQQDLGRQGALVAEGRDMGTVIFPQAAAKFFLDAAPEVRARRRVLQLEEMGQSADYREILAAVQARDAQDRNRASAPLRPAHDAVRIDTGPLDIDGVFAALLAALGKNA